MNERRGKFLHHVTLNTGHTRRSYRDEVDDAAVTLCRDLLMRALKAPTPIPHLEPACTLGASSTSKGLIAAIRTASDNEPIISMAVARHSMTAAKLWRVLIETTQTPITPIDCPPEPWCAVRLEPAAALYPPPHELLPTIADLERCIAWAWMEKN